MSDVADWREELLELNILSAKIGSDPLLTQGAGGNTSLKINGVLWIKASGTWLANASTHNIMVPVELEPLLEAVASSDISAENPQGFIVREGDAIGLRPSIETTVHALMPHRIVLHVHCVDTIAFAVQPDCVERISPRLEGVNWAYIPYARPGLPLAKNIAKFGLGADVLILGNHGLVVCAQSVAEADTLLRDIKTRLSLPPRLAAKPDFPRLLNAAAGTEYRLPTSQAAHALATDPISADHVRAGILFPDQVIFLGDEPAVVTTDLSIGQVLSRCERQPTLLMFPGAGVLIRRDAPPNADAMARCVADVAARIEENAALRVLTAEERSQLTNWDAEKYRQELSKKQTASA